MASRTTSKLLTISLGFLAAISHAQTAPAPEPNTPNSGPALSLPVLSLEDATHAAMEKSPELDQTRARADRAKWQRLESFSGFLPSLTIGGHWLFYQRTPYIQFYSPNNSITSLAPASPFYDAEVSLKVPLFDELRNFDRLSAAGYQSRAADLQVDWQTFNLRQQVRLAYASVLQAKELAKVAEANVKDLQEHHELVQNQIRAGVTTKVSILRIETELSNAISEKTNADSEIQISLQKLAQLMGEESAAHDVFGSLPVPSDADLRAIDEARLSTRPDIEALSLQSQAATDTHRADSKWWLPTFSLIGSYNAVSSQPLKLTSYSFGVAVNLNIFDGLVSYSRSKEALESERIAQRAEESSRLQAQTDFETYRMRYRYNLQRYRARTDDVARATESVRLARAGFRAGIQTSTDVLDAERDLFNARSGQVQAQYGALENLVRFEIALGRNITK